MNRTILLYSLILASYLIISSCNDKRHVSYQATHFEINFLEADNFTNNDWIEIDGTRFDHKRYEKEIFSDENALPASKIVRDSLGPEKKFVEPYNRISIAIMLAEKINRIQHKDDNGKDMGRKYVLSNKPLLMTQGRVRFHKADSSAIRIKTSKEYPAKITSLELE